MQAWRSTLYWTSIRAYACSPETDYYVLLDTRGSRFPADTNNRPSFSPSRMQRGHDKAWPWSHGHAPPSPVSSPPILFRIPPIMLAVRVLLQVLCTHCFFRQRPRRPLAPFGFWMDGAGAESGIYCIALASKRQPCLSRRLLVSAATRSSHNLPFYPLDTL